MTEKLPNDLLLDLLEHLTTSDLLHDLELETDQNLCLLGMGKAAPGLCKTLQAKFKFESSLILGTDIGGHPYMNEGSLLNGHRLQEYLKRISKDQHLVIALTGGASSSVEIMHPFFENHKDHFFLSCKKKLF